MSIPQTEQTPDDPDRLPPARRRRARRLLAPLNSDERAAFLDNLAHRTAPSFDFFLFSLISGLILAIGLLINSPAVLVLGAILAPLMAPVVGIALGTVLGSVRFFLRSLVGLIIGGALVFLCGWLAGLIAPALLPPGTLFSIAQLHAQLSWPDFIVLAIAAILTAASLTHSDDTSQTDRIGGTLRSGVLSSAALPSVALAYELYIPLAVAGLGLGSGLPHLFPDGLLVFVLYLSWAALLGALTLAILGFRPLTLFGYTLSAALILFGVLLLVSASGVGTVATTKIGLPTPTPTITFTPTLTPTMTSTPVPPTSTPTLTPTLTSTLTPTMTLTPTPTPVFAQVQAGSEAGGAYLRNEPGGEIITVVANGTIVEMLPERTDQDGSVWVKVVTPDGQTGWMQLALLTNVTPTPTP
jgi:uncharacterized membrane protein